MNFSVTNHEVTIGDISVGGVGASSIFLIGDTDTISLSSVYDTPPEALIIGPFVPLAPED